jgi:ATP-dependent RNA helicase DeaD
VKFKDFDLNSMLLQAVDDLGYEDATEIQEKAIPLLLEGDRDFVGQAQTGTGKTAAFVLPLLQRLNAKTSHVQALIVVPTRELANQVHKEIEKLGKHMGVVSVPVFGGTSYDAQIRAIKKDQPHVVVGTPGRTMDLMRKKILQLGMADFMILDEADEMLNMGFLEDVQFILEAFKPEKKLWMFSATMPDPILKMIQKDFRQPEIVRIKKKEMSNQDIEQRYYLVRRKYQREALRRLLDSEPNMYGIVFCQTRVETRELAEELLLKGYSVETLHGEMGQTQRDISMARFKAGKVRLMVCTDVAARGIDVNNLTHVINFGLPRDMESYVHRIGRTGRAGLKGVGISLIDPREQYRVRHFEAFIKQKINQFNLPSVEELKLALVQLETANMKGVIEAVLEKGEEYRLDKTFEVFSDELKDLSMDELKKVLFTWGFNAKIRNYDNLGSLDAREERSSGGNQSARGGRSGRGRPSRPGRDGGGGDRSGGRVRSRFKGRGGKPGSKTTGNGSGRKRADRAQQSAP